MMFEIIYGGIMKIEEKEELDFSRALRTYQNKLVTIITTNGPDKEKPIVGSVEGEKEIFIWNKCGINHKREYDLEYTPVREKYYISVTESGTTFHEDFAGLVMYPNVLAQLIVDPSNKIVRIQGFNDAIIENMSEPKKEKMVRAEGQQFPPVTNLVGAFREGNKTSSSRSMLESVEQDLEGLA